MSRTKMGAKRAGWDYWGKRYIGMGAFGAKNKRDGIQRERAIGKRETAKEAKAEGEEMIDEKDEPVYMTASEVNRRWDEKMAEVLKDAGKRIDLAFAAASLGDQNAMSAIKELVLLGSWARKYGIAAVKLGLDNTSSDFCSHVEGDCSWCRPFEEALDQLPQK